MKKAGIILMAIFAISIALVLSLKSSAGVSQQNSTPSGAPIPEDVAAILQNSCAGCHGAGGNGMASAIWSYSDWGNYSLKKQAKKADDICNAATKGSMPPASVKNAAPDKIPSAEQIDIICMWAHSLK